MPYTEDDLRKMMTDCIAEVCSLGYELHPILSIQFTPGLQTCPGYLKADSFNRYSPLDQSGMAAFHIRIHGALKNLDRCAEDYNALKTVVMHNVIHAVSLPEVEKRILCSHLPYCDEYDRIRNEVQAAFGYSHIRDSAVEERRKNRAYAFVLNSFMNKSSPSEDAGTDHVYTYTRADLEEMLQDCTGQLERLGYQVYPIGRINFWKGSDCTLGRITCFEFSKYDSASGYFKEVEAYIEVHQMCMELSRADYMLLKTVVMHEAIHAIALPKKPRGTGALRDPFVRHGPLYETIKNEVETAYGYRHISPATEKEAEDSRLIILFREYCRNKPKKRSPAGRYVPE